MILLPEQSLHRKPPVRWTIILSWIVILVIAGLAFASTLMPELRGKKRIAEKRADMNFQITARYLVGLKHSLGSLGGAQTIQQASAQIRELAKKPEDKPYAAIALGELEGSDAALKILHEIPATQPQPASQQQEASITPILRQLYQQGVDSLSPLEREILRSHGWLGQLALSHGLPDIDPTRAEVISRARSTAIGLLGWAGTMGLLLIAGVLLLIVLLILFATGILRLKGLPVHLPDAPFVEAFSLYLLLFALAQIALGLLKVDTMMWSLPLIILLIPIFLYVRMRGLTWSEVRAGFGLTSGNGVLTEIGMGFVSYVAGLPLIAAGIIIAVMLTQAVGATPSHPIVNEAGKVPILLLYLLASVWAPVFEEIMFRGALFQHVRSRMRWIFAAPIVSVIFAIIHPQGWTLLPALGMIAMVLAFVREWRGSIIAPIIVHGLSNGAVVTLLFLVTR